MENNQIIDKEKEFQNDLDYIKNEIISQQVNGLYCKYSRLLHCITVTNMTKDRYINYEISNYKTKKDEHRKQAILNACIEKLENGLTPLDDMIKLQNESGDRETKDILKVITSPKLNKIDKEE